MKKCVMTKLALFGLASSPAGAFLHHVAFAQTVETTAGFLDELKPFF